MRARKLCAIRRPLVASPAYLERYGRPSHPRELSAYPGLIYTNLASPEFWRFQHAQEGEYGAPVRGRLRANNGEALVPAVLAGLGMALLPEFMVWRELAEGRLEAMLPEWELSPIALNLITPPGAFRPAKVTALSTYLASVFAKAPWAR